MDSNIYKRPGCALNSQASDVSETFNRKRKHACAQIISEKNKFSSEELKIFGVKPGLMNIPESCGLRICLFRKVLNNTVSEIRFFWNLKIL